MSHSLRFLGLAVAAWVGVRAASLGMIPGAEALAIDRPASAEVPVAATTVPPLSPTDLTPEAFAPVAETALAQPPVALPYFASAAPYPLPYRTSYAAYPAYSAPVAIGLPPRRLAAAARYALNEDQRAPLYYTDPVPQLDQWPLSRIASATHPGRAVPQPGISPAPAKLDRLQLAAWAMLRDKPGAVGLASGGTLGGSQAGARLLWRLDPRFAVSLRSSAPIGVGVRGGDVAAGVRYQPFARIPVALTAERRFGLGPDGGRSGFALFAEGGLYQRPILAGFALDGYLQGGVVGARHRLAFVDGSATLTRPLYRNFSGGFGVWGGAQPGLTRLDVGPRLTMRVGRSLRAHLDYRYHLAGNAQPGSGAVVTIAGDF